MSLDSEFHYFFVNTWTPIYDLRQFVTDDSTENCQSCDSDGMVLCTGIYSHFPKENMRKPPNVRLEDCKNNLLMIASFFLSASTHTCFMIIFLIDVLRIFSAFLSIKRKRVADWFNPHQWIKKELFLIKMFSIFGISFYGGLCQKKKKPFERIINYDTPTTRQSEKCVVKVFYLIEIIPQKQHNLLLTYLNEMLNWLKEHSIHSRDTLIALFG